MNVGGPALQVTALTEGLNPDRFETRLLTGSVEPGEADYITLRAPGLPHRHVKGLGRSVAVTGDLRALTGIIHQLRTFEPHIIHTHTAKAGVLGRVAAAVTRSPGLLVHTFHGHLLRGYFGTILTRGIVLTERRLARRTDALVAVGERVRDELLAAGIGTPAQYAVIPPGILLPPPPTRAEARRSLGIDLSAPVVAYVGRLTGVKRPDRFVDVARTVADSLPHARFLIVGEGDLLDATKQAAAALGPRVRFLGWRPDVGTVYSASDVILLTSDNEGMPVSLIEAASIGTPAVATDVGSVREVVVHDETGYVVPADSRSLATGVESLLRDESLRQAMGQAAAARADALFGRARLVADNEALYEKLLVNSDFSLSAPQPPAG